MGHCVHIVKSLVAILLVHSGLLRLMHRMRRPHVLVLAYHRVTPDAEMAGCAYPAMHVSTSTFEAQLQALRCFYRPIPMADLHAILTGATPLRESVAVITFDDGYRDNFQHALPILARQNVPATFFLALDFVARARPFWFDALAEGLRMWDRDAAYRDARRPALPEDLVRSLEAPGKVPDRLRRAAAFLKSLPDAERDAAMYALATREDERGPARAEPMRWDELESMCGQGMRLGAHGVRHAILTRMPADAAEHEIRQSLEGIATRTGVLVEEFAYPNGDADAEVARRAARCGVRLAFTMEPQAVRPGDDPHRLGRRNACEDTSRGAFRRFSASYFFCEITGAFDALLGRKSRRG